MSFVLFTLSTMNCRLNHLENLLSHGTAASSHLDGLRWGLALTAHTWERVCFQMSETESVYRPLVKHCLTCFKPKFT